MKLTHIFIAQRTLAEDQGEVTLLFCDIMDFDKIIQKEGKRVVNLLDHIFRVFDQHCATNGIQKIEVYPLHSNP